MPFLQAKAAKLPLVEEAHSEAIAQLSNAKDDRDELWLELRELQQDFEVETSETPRFAKV